MIDQAESRPTGDRRTEDRPIEERQTMGIQPDDQQDDDQQIDIEVEGKGQRLKLIVSLTWPALAENFLVSVMSMFDMMMVGELGEYAINAVGLITQPRFIMMAAFMAMSTGTTALVARCKGAHDEKGANLALQQSMIISAVMTVAVCIAMIFFCEPLLRWIGGDGLSEKTILEGIKYFKIQIYGFPTLALTFSINASLRGAGNTRPTFYNNSVANIVKVTLNYFLITGRYGFPRLEVAGASIATVIGQTVGLAMALYVAMRGKQYVQLSFKERWHVDFTMIRRVVHIGLPALVEQVIMRVGSLWFTTIVAALGEISFAAHMVAMNLQQISFMTGMSFGVAATTLVGQSLGRKRADLARAYVRMTQNLGIIVSVIVSVILFTCGRLLTGLYTTDTVIIILAADMLKIIAVSNPLSNARFVYISALRGAGDARYMAVITFVGVLLVRPLLSLFLTSAFDMGLSGIWIALVSDGVICYVMSLLRYRAGKWESIKV